MKKNILWIVFFLLLAMGCKKDFLNRPSQNNPTLDNYYSNAEEVNAATGYLYNNAWADYIDKAFNCVGDILSGNALSAPGDANYGNNTYVYYTVQATDGQLLNTWRSFYKVAGTATVLIKTFQEKKAKVSDSRYLDQGIAEARFMRGVAYFNIARVFGNAPIVEDPVKLSGSGNFNVPRYFQKDVLRFALEDLKAAEIGLPATPYQPGRVTSYSAIGMQAKVYLYMKDYANAATKANQVILSGKYSLYSDYEKMFTSSSANNNSESLFALQWIASGGYSFANGMQAYFAPSTLLRPDFNVGYSSVIPSIDVLKAYEFGDKRKKWSVMQHGFTKAEWKNVNFPNGFLYDTTWVSTNDDATKIKTPTRTNILKYVVGTTSSGEKFSAQGGNDLCIYFLRYADILLIYAEAKMAENASTIDASAVAAFNLVHQRAGLAPVSILTKDLILHERRVEFAFEGDYFFDLQRQGYTKAKQLFEAQERGTYNYNGTQINSLKITLNSPEQLFLPIPADEVVADPELSKPPVSYY
jgi:hypothetical protein